MVFAVRSMDEADVRSVRYANDSLSVILLRDGGKECDYQQTKIVLINIVTWYSLLLLYLISRNL